MSSSRHSRFGAEELLSSTYRSLGTPPEVGHRFLDFLLSNHRTSLTLTKLVLRAMDEDTDEAAHRSGDAALEIDAFELIQFDATLGHMLLRHPSTLLPLLEDGAVEAQRELARRVSRSKSRDPRPVRARLVHLPPHPDCCKASISCIEASDVGKVVQIGGTVVRASPVRMVESARVYRCKRKDCGHAFVMYADFEQCHNAQVAPTVCPKRFGEGDRERCEGTAFEVLAAESVHTDYQEIKILESVSMLRVGNIPRSMLVKLEHDLVDCCHPGDEVLVVGSLISQWQPVAANIECNVSMALRAHSITVVNTEDHSNWQKDEANGTAREIYRKEFDAFWNLQDSKTGPILARNFICGAVCPKLYGMLIVKLGLLLTLIGGSANIDADGENEAAVVGEESSDDGQPEQFAVTTETENLDGRQETAEYDRRYGFAGSNRREGSRRRKGNRDKAIQTRRRAQSHILLVGDPGTGKVACRKLCSLVG